MAIDVSPSSTLRRTIQDRDTPGAGFARKRGDRVAIASPKPGRPVDKVRLTTGAPAWRFGARAPMQNLARRGIAGQRRPRSTNPAWIGNSLSPGSGVRVVEKPSMAALRA